MDATEAQVERYLRHLHLGPVIYEPDGNIPPDFVVAGRIAVEARRLNQHETSGGAPRGLEESRFPLIEQVRGLLKDLGSCNEGQSWFVMFHLVRPLSKWKDVRPHIATWLQAFAAEPLPVPHRAKFGTLNCALIPATSPHSQTFVLGGLTDRDAGGWVLYELRRNLHFCIEEKARKVAPYRARYPEWWLVLVDHIAMGLAEHERQLLAQQLQFAPGWKRVVLLDRDNYATALEVGITEAAG